MGLVLNKWNPTEWLSNSLEEGLDGEEEGSEKTGWYTTSRFPQNSSKRTQQQFESFQRKLHGSTKTNSSIGFDPFAGPYEHPINRFSPSYSSPNSSPNNYYFDKH